MRQARGRQRATVFIIDSPENVGGMTIGRLKGTLCLDGLQPTEQAEGRSSPPP
jgi:hypothetical protein